MKPGRSSSKKESSKKAAVLINEGVQVGVPSVKYGRGHYLFDPTKDALYQNTETETAGDTEHLAFIRSAWTSEINAKNVHREASRILRGNLSII
jgi:hypothetical protein